MEVIVTTREQISQIFRAELDRILNVKPQPQQQLPDRCTFDEALEITGLSKSKLYKLTSSNQIPFRKFNKKLIFSRKELQAWVESQTIDKHDTSEIELTLARSARRKRKGGMQYA